IALDGEFQVRPLAEAGEGEGPLFLAPAILIDRNLGRLSGNEGVAVRSFEPEPAHIVRDVLSFEDFDPVRHCTSPCPYRLEPASSWMPASLSGSRAVALSVQRRRKVR